MTDTIESLRADLARVREERDALRLAAERARSCIKGLLSRTPVRDVAETLAELDAAIDAARAKEQK